MVLLLPKKVKWRKVHRKGFVKTISKGNTLSFGNFGLQAIGFGNISNREIEAARIAINKHFNRGGKVWIRIFPSIPITRKPLEVRMGKGKGNLEGWVCQIYPGKVLFEVSGCTRTVARDACCKAAAKINIKTKFLFREEC